MEDLPVEIWDIILDYKSGAEHFDKYKYVLISIPQFFWCKSRFRMNRQFHSIFYPDFWIDLFMDPII